ncbi:Cullin-3 [Bienertia sinuspersici]
MNGMTETIQNEATNLRQFINTQEEANKQVRDKDNRPPPGFEIPGYRNGGEEEPEIEEGGDEEDTHINTVEVSLYFLVGLTNPKTMKMEGKINREKMMVMINPEATHNFLSSPIVKCLGILVIGVTEFRVSLGNRAQVVEKGHCE